MTYHHWYLHLGAAADFDEDMVLERYGHPSGQCVIDSTEEQDVE